MKIETDFTVPLPPEQAYRFLLDLDEVAPCVPGGELGPSGEDGSRRAKVTVRLGPMRLVYDGTLWVAEEDEVERRAVLRARAAETGAQGSLNAAMTMHVTPNGEGSNVAVVTELQLSGRAARIGRGIVDDVARRLVAEMASCLERRLDQQRGADAPGRPASSHISVAKLLLRAVADRLARIRRKGEP
jgi:carbon monoxide dehydrogenase subunit G